MIFGVMAVTLAIAVASYVLLPQKNTSGAEGPFPGNPLTGALVRWDSGWYANIAENGYWYKRGEQSPVAFFPGYPMAVRAVSKLLSLHPYGAGVLITAICGPVALLLFFFWARKIVGETQALASTVLFALYPFAYFLYGVMYSDALYLVMIVPAFLSLERRQVGWATAFGILATLCRPVAPAVVVGLVVRQFELRRQDGLPIRALDLLPALSALGMASWMAYLGLEFGDALAFSHVQSAPGWDHVPGWRSWLKVRFFQTMFPRVDPALGFRLGLHAAIALGALALCIPMRRRLGWGYALYSAIAIGIPAVAMKDFHGMGRYAMAGFPCVLTLSLLLQDRPRLRRAVWVTSGFLLAWFTVEFARGEFTA